jgi:Holliday junction resolvase-like predicted endonuclease
VNRGRVGADAERRLKQQLEAEGYLVVRAAASKGPVDLVAIDGRRVMLIQVKRGRPAGPAERQGLQELAARVPNAVQVWLYERKARRGAEWQARRIKA